MSAVCNSSVGGQRRAERDAPTSRGGTLTCKCSQSPVTVSIKGNVAFNHACGCTKCWKPEGALFSVVAVTSRDNLKVTANAQKLKVVDRRPRSSGMPARAAACTCTAASRTRTIRSMASTSSTSELSKDKGWAAPEFAAFVSSIIESGTKPDQMGAVRARLKELKLEPYDCLSPPLMDLIATHTAKAKGVLAA